MNKIEILKEHENEIRKRFGVKRMGLFGSFSRNERKKENYVDITVEFEKNFGGLVIYLEKLFGRPIDILTPLGIESIGVKEVSK